MAIALEKFKITNSSEKMPLSFMKWTIETIIEEMNGRLKYSALNINWCITNIPMTVMIKNLIISR